MHKGDGGANQSWKNFKLIVDFLYTNCKNSIPIFIYGTY